MLDGPCPSSLLSSKTFYFFPKICFLSHVIPQSTRSGLFIDVSNLIISSLMMCF